MTDPIGGIIGTKETSSGSGKGGGTFAGYRKKRRNRIEEDDVVEISMEARSHFPVKKRRSIIEFLKSLMG